jgi:hypothetical protein
MGIIITSRSPRRVPAQFGPSARYNAGPAKGNVPPVRLSCCQCVLRGGEGSEKRQTYDLATAFPAWQRVSYQPMSIKE